MTTPHPRKDRRRLLASLWRITDHQVIGGLVVAAILAVIGVLFTTHGNGNNSAVSGHGTTQPASPPDHGTTQPATPPTPAPPCPTQTTSSSGPVHQATGQPPWTVEGYGIRYTIVSITRTTSQWADATKPSITITSCITRTQPADNKEMMFRFIDATTSSALDAVPLQGSGDKDPPPNQTSRLISIMWDQAPPTTHLTIILHDFFWPDSHNLTLRDLRVSPRS